MNFDFYLLGTPDGYNQYPLDDKVDLFRSFHDDVKSDTQMTIWRNAELVYYVYTRNLRTAGKNQYFGMAIAINGRYLSNIGNVFSVFEQLCSNIALRGRILNIDKTGKIQFVHSRFVDTPDEIEITIRDCRELVETNLCNDLRHLPVEYVVQRRAITITFDEEFADSKLNGLLQEYNSIHFTKAENEGAGYVDMVITRLYEENRNLQEQYKRLNRQKKQMKWVVLLLLLILAGGVVFYLFARDKNHLIQSKSNEISHLNKTIDNKNAQISSLNMDIKRLKNDSIDLENVLENKTEQLNIVKQKLDDIYSQINSTIPVYIYFPSWTSTNYHIANSTSSKEYTFYAYRNDVLHIPYFVSSESGCDYLTITLYHNGEREQILHVAGSYSRAYKEYTFQQSGTYRMIVEYSKDYNTNHGNDNAGVDQFYIYRPIVNTLLRMAEYYEE